MRAEEKQPIAPEETLPDVAAIYPAEDAYWADCEVASIWDVTLLSLGIEPRGLEIQRELALAQSDVAWYWETAIDQAEDILPISFGLQDEEFHRRLGVILNSLQAGSLSLIPTPDRGTDIPTSRLMRLSDFAIWARTKSWPMPSWMDQKVPVPALPAAHSHTPSPARANQLERTQARYARWQAEAESIKQDRPNLSKIEIAKRIARRPTIADGASVNTIRQNIDV